MGPSLNVSPPSTGTNLMSTSETETRPAIIVGNSLKQVWYVLDEKRSMGEEERRCPMLDD